MNVREFKKVLDEALSQLPHEYGHSEDDVEVRFAMNPAWAMEYGVDPGPDIVVTEVDTGEFDRDVLQSNVFRPTVYIALDQIGYLSQEGMEVLGWGH